MPQINLCLPKAHTNPLLLPNLLSASCPICHSAAHALWAVCHTQAASSTYGPCTMYLSPWLDYLTMKEKLKTFLHLYWMKGVYYTCQFNEVSPRLYRNSNNMYFRLSHCIILMRAYGLISFLVLVLGFFSPTSEATRMCSYPWKYVTFTVLVHEFDII